MATQDIIRRSGTSAATPASQTRIGDVKQVAKLFDATKCNAVRPVRWRAPNGTICVKKWAVSREVIKTR